MSEYPVTGSYPIIEACNDIANATWKDIFECKFNLFNKLQFPFEAAR